MAFRVMFVIVAYYNFDINQINVKTTIPYKLIDQLVYIQIPKASEIFANKNIVCKLLTASKTSSQAVV